MDQQWFEMPEVRRRKLNTAVWIPLRAAQYLDRVGELGHPGYHDEFFGAGSIAVLLDKRIDVERLDWSDVGIRHSHGGWFDGHEYVPADVLRFGNEGLEALGLAFEQEGNGEDPEEWHLHQDFVITLNLKREGDVRLAMNEGYIEVARLKRDADGKPILLEVRSEHLKDYLCARGMALYISSY